MGLTSLVSAPPLYGRAFPAGASSPPICSIPLLQGERYHTHGPGLCSASPPTLDIEGWLLSSKRCRITKHANKSFRTDPATFVLAVVRIPCVDTEEEDSERSYLFSAGKWKRPKRRSWRNHRYFPLRWRAVLLSRRPPFDKGKLPRQSFNSKRLLSANVGLITLVDRTYDIYRIYIKYGKQ